MAIATQMGSPFLDPSGKDVSRGCFISWDPNLYCNPEAEVYRLPYTQDKPKVADEELDDLLKEALARAFPAIQPRTDILAELLDQVEPVNFRELAQLEDDGMRLNRKHYA